MTIHLRKTMTGVETWCGVSRDEYKIMRGGRDNTSPHMREATCQRCIKAATKWMDEYENKRARKERLAKGEDGMKHVYVAGPYTHPEPVENTHKAIRVANRLVACGFTPIIPRLTLAWNLVSPMPAKFWYDYTLQLMFRCDIVYRMAGDSVGGDIEVAEARKAGIPVFMEIDGASPENLDLWLKKFECAGGRYRWQSVHR
jgi:hypothetical protein